mgnify:CR=1 FL=1
MFSLKFFCEGAQFSAFKAATNTWASNGIFVPYSVQDRKNNGNSSSPKLVLLSNRVESAAKSAQKGELLGFLGFGGVP